MVYPIVTEIKDPDELFGALLTRVSENKNIDISALKKAYRIAAIAHMGQFRSSNVPYILHPLYVAYTVADLHMDTVTIVSALLHDTLEDTQLTYDKVSRLFSPKVADMVQALTKLEIIENDHLISDEKIYSENYRNLLCAVSKDIRVIIIKIADRLHNMETLQYIANEKKRKRIAKETLEVHVALSERIGLNTIKSRLQELVFKELYPKERQYILQKIDKVKQKTQSSIINIIERLQKCLSEKQVDYIKVDGREKTAFSAWEKTKSKKTNLEELSDIFAFRVTVKATEDCYKALYAIHSEYRAVHSELKDYISSPKSNGYQAIHTILHNKKGRIEVQIKTFEMHNIAGYGLAAHWRYKQQIESSNLVKHFNWINEVIRILQKSTLPEDILEGNALNVNYEQVYCYNKSGEIILLPQGSTALDYAFFIDKKTGLMCKSLFVNDQAADQSTKLTNGDKVEVIISEKVQASKLWLEVLKTEYAKDIIKDYFRNLEKSYANASLKEKNKYQHLLQNHNDILQSTKISKFIYTIHNFVSKIPISLSKILKPKQNSDFNDKQHTDINLRKKDFMLCELCMPLPNDKIIVSGNDNTIIHRIECINKNPQIKIIQNIDYDFSIQKTLYSELIIVLKNEIGALQAFLAIASHHSIMIESFQTLRSYDGFTECAIRLKMTNTKSFNKFWRQTEHLNSLHSITRCIKTAPNKKPLHN